MSRANSPFLGPLGYRALAWTDNGLVSPSYSEFSWDATGIVTAACKSCMPGEYPNLHHSCGIYVTTDLNIALPYLSLDDNTKRLGVMTIVECVGRVVDSHTKGWRTEEAVIVGLVNINAFGQPVFQKDGTRTREADILLWAVEFFERTPPILDKDEAEMIIRFQKRQFNERVNTGELKIMEEI